MKLGYRSKKVARYFNDFILFKKEKGPELAIAAKLRIDQLKAAENFQLYLDTGLGRPHPLAGNFHKSYGINMTGRIRLIVTPIADNLSRESLKLCEEIVIERVADYHGRKIEWIIP